MSGALPEAEKNEWDFDDKMPAARTASRLRSAASGPSSQSRDGVGLSALRVRIPCAVATASRKHGHAAGVVSSRDTMRRPARSSTRVDEADGRSCPVAHVLRGHVFLLRLVLSWGR